MDSVLTRLAQDSIGVGQLGREFAQGVARYVGRRHGVALRTEASALRCAIDALGLAPGSRIGLSVLARGFVHRAIVACGHVPVPIDTQKTLPLLPSPLDVDFSPFSLDALYVDTRLGYVPPLAVLRELGLPTIEDVSEGLGANTGDAMVGSSGEITLVAVEAHHVLTAGGGAVLATSGSRRASAMQAAIGHNLGEPALSDMNAALGLTQLKQLERFLDRRRELAARFTQALGASRHRVPPQNGDAENVFYALPVLVSSSVRDVEAYARNHGVSVERALGDSVLAVLNPTSEDDRDSGDAVTDPPYPNALALSGRLVLFPLYPSLSGADQDRIVRVLSTLP